MPKLTAIEGLRGYLALWVLLSHSLQAVNYSKKLGAFKLLGQPDLAVDCFMIISGFVIFMLIDQKKETYRLFILRRAFRIFPVYLFLFAVSIPCSLLTLSTVTAPGAPYTAEKIVGISNYVDSIWANIWIHIPLHMTLLQGLIPRSVLPHSPTAFLGPAWSLSLEWQFYLLAPFWWAAVVSNTKYVRMLMYGFCILVICTSRKVVPEVEQGAHILLRLEYFFVGVASYSLFNALRSSERSPDFILPMTVVLTMGLYKVLGQPATFVPLCIWSLVLALLLEHRAALSSRAIAPVLENRVSVWIGKISYSVYLSHTLVLTLCQYSILKLLPHAAPVQHLIVLTVGTLVGALLLASLLYRFIEAPFIEMGRGLAAKMAFTRP